MLCPMKAICGVTPTYINAEIYWQNKREKKENDRLIEWGGAGWQMVAWLKQYISDRQERGTCGIFSDHCISSKFDLKFKENKQSSSHTNFSPLLGLMVGVRLGWVVVLGPQGCVVV